MNFSLLTKHHKSGAKFTTLWRSNWDSQWREQGTANGR